MSNIRATITSSTGFNRIHVNNDEVLDEFKYGDQSESDEVEAQVAVLQ